MASPDAAIPVVDFGGWADGSVEERRRIAAELTGACREVGFVYVVGHGVPTDLVDEAFAWSKKLFALPEDVKRLAPHPPGPDVHRGYSWPGLEKVSQYVHREGDDADAAEAALRAVADCKESYEIGSEELELQPNVWLPEAVLPGFRGFMTAFYWRCFGAARDLLRALAVGLGADADCLARLHSGHNCQLRLLHYPPVETARLARGAVARMPAHSDWGAITLLFQEADDDDGGGGGGGGGGGSGLQVEHPRRPGRFVDAAPPRHALVVNVGDLLMRWSNDYLKSTLHRVTVPPAVAGRGPTAPPTTPARYSIPFFVAPDPEAVIACIPECASEAGPPKYAPVTQDAYRRMRARLQYSDKPPAG